MAKPEPLRLTRAQVREIDRRAIEEFHIPGIVLMENAARGVADVAWEMVARKTGAPILIVCGTGNNGGDGLAAARHLHNRGAQIELGCLSTDYTGDALINFRIVEEMGLCDPFRQTGKPMLIIDALFGTGLTRPVEGIAAGFIVEMNERGVPILAVDLPSGLDCDTGEPLGKCVRATHTVTFVAEKFGFANPRSREFTGRISVADIGCPRDLIDEVARSFPSPREGRG